MLEEQKKLLPQIDAMSKELDTLRPRWKSFELAAAVSKEIAWVGSDKQGSSRLGELVKQITSLGQARPSGSAASWVKPSNELTFALNEAVRGGLIPFGATMEDILRLATDVDKQYKNTVSTMG